MDEFIKSQTILLPQWYHLSHMYPLEWNKYVPRGAHYHGGLAKGILLIKDHWINIRYYIYIYIYVHVCVCMCMCCVLSCSFMSDSLWSHELQATGLLCPWDFPGKNSGVGCHALLQGIFPSQGSNSSLLHLQHWQAGSLPHSHLGSPHTYIHIVVVYSWVVSDSFATPWTVAHQVPLFMGFSRQEYWSGLPSPSPYTHTHTHNAHWCLSPG